MGSSFNDLTSPLHQGGTLDPSGSDGLGLGGGLNDEDDDMPNLLDYLDEFGDGGSGSDLETGCFSVLHSLLNDEPLSMPSSPNFAGFNFGLTSADVSVLPAESEQTPSQPHSQSDEINPPEAKKICASVPVHSSNVNKLVQNLHNGPTNKMQFMKSRDEADYNELGKLLDSTSHQQQQTKIGSEKSIPDISHFSSSSLRESSSFGSPATPDFGTSPSSGTSFNSDDTGFRSGSSMSAEHSGSRCCCEPTIVKLKQPEETSRFCFETLQRCAQTVSSLLPFKGLLREDRALLIGQSWVSIFLIAITEEQLDIKMELKNFCNRPNAVPCWKQTICANKLARIFAEKNQLPTCESVNTVKAMLNKIAGLKLSDEEYFYLKIIALFNPELVLLKNSQLVYHNRAMAEQALRDHCRLTQQQSYQQQQQQQSSPSNVSTGGAGGGGKGRGGDPPRLSPIQLDPLRPAHCLSLVAHLREMSPQTVTELFFRPVLGAGLDMADVVMEMFNSKDEQFL